MVLWICGSTMALFLALQGTTFLYDRQETLEETEHRTRTLARYFAEKFENRVRQVAAVPRMMALHLELASQHPEDELRRYMRRVLQQNPAVYGTAVAFEPSARAAAERGGSFAPYYHRTAGPRPGLRFVQLGDPGYDYKRRAWYRQPIKAGAPVWTEPYFDEGGGEALMITHAVPFGDGKKVRGVVTADISLAALSREVGGIRVARTGYGFIVSKQGRYVSFPDASRIMKGNITSFNEALARSVRSELPGFVRCVEPGKDRPVWVAHHPIPTADLTIAVVYPEDEVMHRIHRLEYVALALGIAGLLCLYLLIRVLSGSISRPITALSEAADRVARGDLSRALPEAAGQDEVFALTRSFNTMVRDLRRQMEDLRRTTAEKERIASELKIAADMQRSILPGEFSGHDHVDLYGTMIPAREVGGDLYDFFFLEDGRLGFVVGDVSGKGMPAAIFMAVSRTLTRATALTGVPAARCMELVNRALCLDSDESAMFVTMCYGILDPRSGELDYCLAGHNPPLLLGPGDETRYLQRRGGMALGVMPDAPYAGQAVTLAPGDLLLLYTDGVTEAETASHEQLGKERLEAYLSGTAGQPPQAVVQGLLELVRRHADGAEQADDITVLALMNRG